jgi:UDP-3-O-[3-hydroxymyristoyl] glucosamine N-acyltransferase
MKLSEIATALNARLIGNGDIEIERPVHPKDAETSQDLALAMEQEALDALVQGTPARAALVRDDAKVPKGALEGCIVVGRSRYAMSQLISLFPRPPYSEPGIHPSAVVDKRAEIGRNVRIGPFCYVGPQAVIADRTILLAHTTVSADARIAEDCLIYPGARIGERVVIGKRAIIHHNASLGADGFSFVTPEPSNVDTAKASGELQTSDQELVRINSLGTVILGDDVEIGAGACIDRGTVSATRVGRNTKIDDLVMVGHNCVIGENSMLCGQVGIAGSTVVGDRVVLGGKVGVADHLRIGSDSVIGGGTMIGINVRPKSLLMGWPPQTPKDTFTTLLTIRRVKRVLTDLEDLKRRVAALDGGAAGTRPSDEEGAA